MISPSFTASTTAPGVTFFAMASLTSESTSFSLLSRIAALVPFISAFAIPSPNVKSHTETGIFPMALNFPESKSAATACVVASS